MDDCLLGDCGADCDSDLDKVLDLGLDFEVYGVVDLVAVEFEGGEDRANLVGEGFGMVKIGF